MPELSSLIDALTETLQLMQDRGALTGTYLYNQAHLYPASARNDPADTLRYSDYLFAAAVREFTRGEACDRCGKTLSPWQSLRLCYACDQQPWSAELEMARGAAAAVDAMAAASGLHDFCLPA